MTLVRVRQQGRAEADVVAVRVDLRRARTGVMRRRPSRDGCGDLGTGEDHGVTSEQRT